jgi:DNA polymerase III psi subunit
MTDASDPASNRQGSVSALQRLWSWISGIPAVSDIRNIADVTTNSARILGAQIARADQMDVLFEELKQHVWESFRLIAEANQRLAETNQRLAEISRSSDVDRAQVQGLRREIMFQQRRLSRLGENISISESAHPQIGKDLSDERIDSLYVAFEDVFRGSRDDIKCRLAPYLEQIDGAGAGGDGKPILDIGCGRGEWLELLRERGRAVQRSLQASV